MHWQDWVISIGQVIFLIAFIPTIKGKNKPELSTSAITALILVFFSITYLSLNLIFSTITSVAMCIAWATVAYQKFQMGRKK